MILSNGTTSQIVLMWFYNENFINKEIFFHGEEAHQGIKFY